MQKTAEHTLSPLIDKALAEEPIILPGNPLWEVFADFGRDELIALVINTVGVGALSTVTSDPLLLAVAGPVLEKIGFFAHSSKEAFDLHNTTEPADRKPKHAYLIDGIKNGLPNLTKDIFIHDPLYATLLLLELQRFPETPVWMLSIIAFMVSVAAIAGGEVTLKEAGYALQKQRLQQRGFELEKHLESRFVVKNIDAHYLLQELAGQFQLGDIHTSIYHDTYFPTKLAPYNNRQPVVRIRRRTELDGLQEEDHSEKIQVVYTRNSQVKNDNPDQFNYFPVSKDKFHLPHAENTVGYLRSIADTSQEHDVRFMRSYAHVPEELLISTDQIDNGEHSYTVVEIKSFRDNKDAVNQMITAMRHIMSRYDVVQTTLSKRKLTDTR